MGLRNSREWLAWKGVGPQGEDDDPRFVWIDTKGNRRAVAAIQTMVVNPDNPEDALKVDADPQTGAGRGRRLRPGALRPGFAAPRAPLTVEG